jgi:hypothetical protein
VLGFLTSNLEAVYDLRKPESIKPTGRLSLAQWKSDQDESEREV